jgi:hypothetical protein
MMWLGLPDAVQTKSRMSGRPWLFSVMYCRCAISSTRPAGRWSSSKRGNGRSATRLVGLIQATQDPVGQVADVVGQGHGAAPGSQPASSRTVWIRVASPVRPKLMTMIAGLPSREIALESTQ